MSPIWVPLLLGLAAYVTDLIGPDMYRLLPDWLSAVGGILIFSLLMGGIQYCIALRIVWTRIDFERIRSWILGIFWLPIIFTPIQVGVALLFIWTNINGMNDWKSVGLMAILDLVVGYGYVLVWLLGLAFIHLFQRFRRGATL